MTDDPKTYHQARQECCEDGLRLVEYMALHRDEHGQLPQAGEKIGTEA